MESPQSAFLAAAKECASRFIAWEDKIEQGV